MHESVIRELQVIMREHILLPSVNSLANKDWVRPVPAAAVIRAVRVVSANIGLKASVAGLVSFL